MKKSVAQLIFILGSGLVGAGGLALSREIPRHLRAKKIDEEFMKTRSEFCSNGHYYTGECRGT